MFHTYIFSAWGEHILKSYTVWKEFHQTYRQITSLNLPEASFIQVHHISIIMPHICSEVKVVQDQCGKARRLNAKKKKLDNRFYCLQLCFYTVKLVIKLFEK